MDRFLLGHLQDEAAAFLVVFIVDEVATQADCVVLAEGQAESKTCRQVVHLAEGHVDQFVGVLWQSRAHVGDGKIDGGLGLRHV